MNFSEFKKLMGADPLNQDPETLRARQSGPEFEQAASEAENFERKLKAALELPVGSGELVNDILRHSVQSRRAPSRGKLGWMAIAAGLFIVIGVATVFRAGIFQPDTVELYVAQHYHHDGERLLAKAVDVVEPGKVNKILAKWGLEASPELANRVTYIRSCITMDGWGAHMIVETDQGMVNLIVMPKTPVTDRELVVFDDMQAYLVAIGDFSAAIIGRQDQTVAGLDMLVRNAIFKAT